MNIFTITDAVKSRRQYFRLREQINVEGNSNDHSACGHRIHILNFYPFFENPGERNSTAIHRYSRASLFLSLMRFFYYYLTKISCTAV